MAPQVVGDAAPGASAGGAAAHDVGADDPAGDGRQRQFGNGLAGRARKAAGLAVSSTGRTYLSGGELISAMASRHGGRLPSRWR